MTVTKKNGQNLIDIENRFIELGKILVQSMQIGKTDFVKCEICLAEIYRKCAHIHAHINSFKQFFFNHL